MRRWRQIVIWIISSEKFKQRKYVFLTVLYISRKDIVSLIHSSSFLIHHWFKDHPRRQHISETLLKKIIPYIRRTTYGHLRSWNFTRKDDFKSRIARTISQLTAQSSIVKIIIFVRKTNFVAINDNSDLIGSRSLLWYNGTDFTMLYVLYVQCRPLTLPDFSHDPLIYFLSATPKSEIPCSMINKSKTKHPLRSYLLHEPLITDVSNQWRWTWKELRWFIFFLISITPVWLLYQYQVKSGVDIKSRSFFRIRSRYNNLY